MYILVVDVVVDGVQDGTQGWYWCWPRHRLGLREKRKKSCTQTQKVTVNWWLSGWLEYGDNGLHLSFTNLLEF